jgi:hypothetical protein
MSYEHAKAMAHILLQQLEGREREFGPIHFKRKKSAE